MRLSGNLIRIRRQVGSDSIQGDEIMDKDIRIVEINGVKVEVDMRYAKRIEQFRVGDTVKVLDNRNDRNEIKTGVITDFAMFKELPTIMVAVYKAGDYWSKPTIEFVTYNNNTEGIEIVGVSQEEVIVSRETIVQKFDDEIMKKRSELDDLIIKRDTFVKYFGSNRGLRFPGEVE